MKSFGCDPTSKQYCLTARLSKEGVSCARCSNTISLWLQRVVPEGIQEVTHAFESIGHIAHLNLRDALLPYKHIIGQVSVAAASLQSHWYLATCALLQYGPISQCTHTFYTTHAAQLLQVILDKNPAIKTVVNKVNFPVDCYFRLHKRSCNSY